MSKCTVRQLRREFKFYPEGFLRFLTKLILILCLSHASFTPLALAESETTNLKAKKIRRATAAVIFSSLGGAVLGLSTLSFYGEPQEHTSNITNGALLGFVAGLGYVLYSTNKKSEYQYQEEVLINAKPNGLALTYTF